MVLDDTHGLSTPCKGRKICVLSRFNSIHMVQITLPDGSQREFPGPVTVAEVAASIGAGLAKAALAGFDNNDWRQSLEALADFAVSRLA